MSTGKLGAGGQEYYLAAVAPGSRTPRRPFGALDRDSYEQRHARERVNHVLQRIAPERHVEPVGIELGL